MKLLLKWQLLQHRYTASIQIHRYAASIQKTNSVPYTKLNLTMSMIVNWLTDALVRSSSFRWNSVSFTVFLCLPEQNMLRPVIG